MTVRLLRDYLHDLPPDLEVRVWDPSEGISFPVGRPMIVKPSTYEVAECPLQPEQEYVRL